MEGVERCRHVVQCHGGECSAEGRSEHGVHLVPVVRIQQRVDQRQLGQHETRHEVGPVDWELQRDRGTEEWPTAVTGAASSISISAAACAACPSTSIRSTGGGPPV
jgi:hypothetical protein